MICKYGSQDLHSSRNELRLMFLPQLLLIFCYPPDCSDSLDVCLIGVVSNEDIMKINHEILDIPKLQIYGSHNSWRCIGVTLLHDK